MRFYVYLKFDPHGIPLWVGKGHGNRSAHDELGEDLPTVLLWDDLTEREAYRIERIFIDAIGRRVTGSGPLVNLHAGGTGGIAGQKHKLTPEGRAKQNAVHTGNTWNLGKQRSGETRTKQSAGVARAWKAGRYTGNGAKVGAALRGRKLTEEHKANAIAGRRGYRHSEETKAKMSAAQKGHVVSEETRAKLSATLKGRPRGW